MLTETAKVLAISNGSILIEASNDGHCSSCSANSACGHSLLSKLHPYRNNFLKISETEFAGIEGDSIKIGIEESKLLHLSLIFYLLPLFSMMASVLIMDFYGFNEALIIFSSLSGLILGFLSLGVITRRYKLNPGYQAIVLPATRK